MGFQLGLFSAITAASERWSATGGLGVRDSGR